MTNSERRQLLNRTKQVQAAGINVSIMDAFANPNVLIQAEQQLMQQTQQPTREVATTPEQQQQGLQGRPPEQIPDEYVMQGVPPGSSVHTNNVKVPLDIDYKDPNTGHLVESFKNVQPGTVLPGTPHGAPVDVIESRAKFRFGGIPRKKQVGGPIKHSQDGPRIPELTDAEMSLKILQEANAGNPAARRMRSDYGQRLDNKTHFMASIDREAVPLVQEEYIGGPLYESNNPPPSSSDFKFDTSREADYFSKNYKEATAAKTFNKRQIGARAKGGQDFRMPSAEEYFKMPPETMIEIDPTTGEDIASFNPNAPSPSQGMDYSTMLHRPAFQKTSFNP